MVLAPVAVAAVVIMVCWALHAGWWEMIVAVAAVGVTVCWGLHAWWWDVKFRGRLPPGSMGWPLLGESLNFVYSRGYSNKALPFFDQHQTRYGRLFKSHLFGHPTIISTSASINSFILQKEGLLFKASYPAQMVRMVGEAIHGQVHAQYRKQIMSIIGPSSLPKYVSEIEENILERLSTWEQQSVVLLREEACTMFFGLTIKRLIGLSTKDEQVQDMMKSLGSFIGGIGSLPINIPGTSFNLGLKGRAKVIQILGSIIQQRRNSQHSESSHVQSPKDLLDALLEEEKRNSEMSTQHLIVYLLVGIIFAAYETIAASLTFIVMLLDKHQEVVDKLLVEHMEIKRKRDSDNRGLTWEDYKSMSYTKDVIYESLRLGNSAPFVFREALTDVEIEGYTIPKGWKVIPSLSSCHVDPTNYKDPLDFQPSRWKDDSSPKVSFMPFGGGSRLCAGNEITLLQISIFLHYFLIEYKWSKVSKERIIRSPTVKYQYGYPLKITKKMSS